ncbi:hypothetical protein I7I50_08915 [Histoplasma capsulatum G186AR]|uniref:Uncharacterized protein n=1 Tax=Ajellomyces capsulatus TaxID=5037 RepID=A0A8H7YP89_AJECA|nr:hypothetical protein I7I52_06431 [Histoplasma capsulatum]QSS73958.1 hypothetical protein I7I50_08915 [Histoplasma capsulatum G186AR]
MRPSGITAHSKEYIFKGCIVRRTKETKERNMGSKKKKSQAVRHFVYNSIKRNHEALLMISISALRLHTTQLVFDSSRMSTSSQLSPDSHAFIRREDSPPFEAMLARPYRLTTSSTLMVQPILFLPSIPSTVFLTALWRLLRPSRGS